jgi:hypothetical protein
MEVRAMGDPNVEGRHDFSRNPAPSPTDAEEITKTDGGNAIYFDDRPYKCSEHDDYERSPCGAHSVAGTYDEVLVIESGNPEDCSTDPGSGHGDELLTPVAGESLDGLTQEVKGALDKFDRPTETTGVKYRLATAEMDNSGRDLAPLQESGQGCKYKSHVVRRELVHGSYEEHIEGDRYTTIEGTWITKIKGHLWNTFYGVVHDDFMEDHCEVFRKKKTEINVGPIIEVNVAETVEHDYGACEETYYSTNTETYKGNVVNKYEKQVKETYEDNVTNKYGDHGAYIQMVEEFFGDKHQIVYGTESNVNLGNENDVSIGLLISIALGLRLNLLLAGGFSFEKMFFGDFNDTKLEKSATALEQSATKFENVPGVKVGQGGMSIENRQLSII